MSVQSKNPWKEWLVLIILLIITALVAILFPAHQSSILKESWSLGKEMLMILPAVLILMGLFSVWISRDMVVRHLGQTSGIRGVALALLFGATPTGPLYVAFPIAAALRHKGARLSNIVIFLTAWACIKLPQEMVELNFLGARFMITRLILTSTFAILTGLIIEKILDRQNIAPENRKGDD